MSWHFVYCSRHEMSTNMTRQTFSDSDYLGQITEFISFLSTKGLTLDAILRHMVLVVLSPLNAEAISLRQVNSGNQAVRIATWGMPPEMVQSPGDVYYLNEKYPSTDTLQLRRTTWINTLPDFGDDYPLLKAFPYTTGAKSFIAFPIEKAGTPVAALGFFSRDIIHPNSEIESFLTAVGSVFSMYLFRQDSKVQKNLKFGRKRTHSDTGSAVSELTELQTQILRLVSENQTDFTMSELLGYSESTIRQELIKIYSKLRCTSREEAIRIYQQRLAQPNQ